MQIKTTVATQKNSLLSCEGYNIGFDLSNSDFQKWSIHPLEVLHARI